MKIQITKRENGPTKATAEIALDGEPVFRVRIMEGRYGFFIVFPEPTSFDMRKRMEIQNAVVQMYRKII